MIRILRLTNDVNEVPRLAEWIEQLAVACQLTPDMTFRLNLALEEAVVNVIEYAYPEQQGMPISLIAERLPNYLRFTLDDQGIPFDPTQVENPNISLSAEDRPIGGLGILLVKQYMTDITYRYVDGHNQLLMTFPLTIS